MSKFQSKTQRVTKAVTLSQEFLRAAAGNEEEALAYKLLSAFGVTLEDCIAVVNKAIDAGDSKIIVMMMAAGVQVRGNVTFVGRDYANVRSAYPLLVIEGEREVKDVFNFSALHICGHLLAHATRDPLGERVLNKGGDCIFGKPTLTTEAGEINAEVAAGWSPESLTAAREWEHTMQDHMKAKLDKIVSQFSTLSASFTSKMTPSSGAKVGAATTSAEKASAPTVVTGMGKA